MGKIALIGLLLMLVSVAAWDQLDAYETEPQLSSEEQRLTAHTAGNDSSSSSSSSSSESGSEESSESVDSNTLMLCNVLARATRDLYTKEGKSVGDALAFLDNDCNSLGDEELIGQCHAMITQYGAKIYQYATEGMEMSEVCKQLDELDEMDLDNEKTTECTKKADDKCRCCQTHVEKRKKRYRMVIRLMTKRRLRICEKSPRPQQCRYYIRREEHEALKRIDHICPYLVCRHLGFCTKTSEGSNNDDPQLADLLIDTSAFSSPPSWDSLISKLETVFSEQICPEYGPFQSTCVHLTTSCNSHHYTKIYLALLNSENKWIDDDLRERLQSFAVIAHTNPCDDCNFAVQSTKDFDLETLRSIRSILNKICAQGPAKEACDQFFGEQVAAVESYVNNIKVNEVCEKQNFCSSVGRSPLGHVSQCDTCVQRLQPHKDAALRAIGEVLLSFSDRCENSNDGECQPFLEEILTEIRSAISEFDIPSACQAIGLCGENALQAVNDYENALVSEAIDKVCPKLGAFESICQKVVRGDVGSIQRADVNIDHLEDVLENCEATTDEEPESNDKCQRCIQRVIRKKKCAKIRVAKYVAYMLHLCDRCPARQECRKYWKEREAYWNAKIDKICPKKACVHMGYCDKESTSPPSICAFLGPFKEACERALNSFQQSVVEPLINDFSEREENQETHQNSTFVF